MVGYDQRSYAAEVAGLISAVSVGDRLPDLTGQLNRLTQDGTGRITRHAPLDGILRFLVCQASVMGIAT
jgi:hypothetical protein